MSAAMDFVDCFRKDGYVIARGAIHDDELDCVARSISAVFVRRAQALGLDVPTGHDRESITQQLTTLFEHAPSTYTSAAKLTQHLVEVHRLGISSVILDAIGALGIDVPALSTRPVIHYMANSLKIEGGYHKTPPHQDWRSVQGSLDGVTLWLPLFDVGEDDYPLEIVCGSHLRGLLPSEDDAFGHRVARTAVENDVFTSVPVKRGDVVIFSGFLVHRTGDKGGAQARVALSYRFNNAADPTFVQRGYPDRYVYRAEKPLLDPAFATAADVQKKFLAT